MAHLIDKDALVAEIERMQDAYIAKLESRGMGHEEAVIASISYVNGIKDAINSLEVKEVDLDFTKEVDVWIEDNGDSNGFFNVQDLAKHFFELGLRASQSIAPVYGIEEALKENGIDPDSKEADMYREAIYKIYDRLKAQKGNSMTDKEKLEAIRAEIYRLVDVRGYDRGMANNLLTFMDSLPNEPVSEELIDVAKQYVKEHVIGIDKVTFSIATDMFISGAKWQKAHNWKPADGDDLPEIDREVIALLDNGKVVFAHRPPEFWDGKNIITGKVTRNYPKTYDKGGWNIPNIKYWLDCLMPKEIEL